MLSQNTWPVLESGSDHLHTWNIPARNGHLAVTLRSGSAGFLLCHYALWYAETIEDLTGKVVDDWGYAFRPIRGQSSGFSNHASGTAMDLNATQHPLGVAGTLTPSEKVKIERRLKLYRGALRSGAFYHGRVDEMHVEIDAGLTQAEKVAKVLMRFGRGARLLKANPDQKAVILS